MKKCYHPRAEPRPEHGEGWFYCPDCKRLYNVYKPTTTNSLTQRALRNRTGPDDQQATKEK